jgi:hypothetical protein
MDKRLLSWSIPLVITGMNLSGAKISANPIPVKPSPSMPVKSKAANVPSSGLKVVYPPTNHETISDRIFFIGTAPPNTDVTINGKTIGNRSSQGHFAPTLPLQLGENIFTLQSKGQTLTLKVIRRSTTPALQSQLGFAPKSLTPVTDIARLPAEPLCFSAIGPLNARIRVRLGQQTISRSPKARNHALLDKKENGFALTMVDGSKPARTDSLPLETCPTP